MGPQIYDIGFIFHLAGNDYPLDIIVSIFQEYESHLRLQYASHGYLGEETAPEYYVPVILEAKLHFTLALERYIPEHKIVAEIMDILQDKCGHGKVPVTIDDIAFASNLRSSGLRVDEIASLMWKRRERLFADIPVLSRTVEVPSKGLSKEHMISEFSKFGTVKHIVTRQDIAFVQMATRSQAAEAVSRLIDRAKWGKVFAQSKCSYENSNRGIYYVRPGHLNEQELQKLLRAASAPYSGALHWTCGVEEPDACDA